MHKSLYGYCIEGVKFEPLVQRDKEKNKDLTVRDVSYGSHKKIWWQCSEGHIRKAVIHSRAKPQKYGCPVCAGKAHRDIKEERTSQR